MITKRIEIEEEPVLLQDLLAFTESGEQVIIAKNDRELARLIPAKTLQPRVGNLNPGSIIASKDFDDPLPDSFWLGEE